MARAITPQMVGASSHDGRQDNNGLRMRGRDVTDGDEDEDDEGPFVQQESMSPEERRISKLVAIVSGLDLLASGAVLISSFSTAYKDAGVSLWCMGIQAISHLLSSVMLLLRFKGESNFSPHTDEASAAGLLRKTRRRWLVREQIGAITMGIVMLLSSAGLLFKAFRKIKFWKVWYKEHLAMDAVTQRTIEGIAWYGFSIYFLQAVFRFWAARKLKGRSILWHGFSASVVSMLFLLIMGFAASYQKEWSWKAEPIGAIALSFVTLAEGIRIVIMHLDDMDTRLRHDPRA
mmetsp:Transcript_37157/g.94399  ORF Transcript_37157/g.94399 Transcript_37157/m.94399 type:complete len:289 (-) Transcript_37157:67-933(-)|eukprot:CAMPEP_0183404308 /NCGR_PEP_ID=MMETSP0370-20130417/15086_1 /TAXON_ID=268820 /ORGANISM="Peridinium aciculiferum, Strain PAER-2" /LENGTH=288 /DNA_ID=CAMNT_0025586143 /DNA_START=66 /DNA_END=932 /DNA_ORIENTATION=-